MESIARRLAGYLIDLCVITIVGLATGYRTAEMTSTHVGFSIGLVGAAYLLLRDIAGASLGKVFLGVRVVAASGGPASVRSRILRNVTVALGPILAIATPPDTGLRAVTQVVGGLIVLVDVVFLLQGGLRLGDRIAGTKVVCRSAV
jgi:uncharacterized RDD family membrane protein YckC